MATSRPSAFPQQQLERCFIPSLIMLDAAVTNAHELMWKREYRKQRTFDAADHAMRQPNYAGPDPETWTIFSHLFQVRNDIAIICGSRGRSLRDSTVGYAIDPQIASQLQISYQNLLPILKKIDVSKARIGWARTVDLQTAPASQEEIETHLLPIIRHTDDVISRIEGVIYKDEFAKNGKVRATDAVIRDLTFSTPNALRRNHLLEGRNAGARECALQERSRHYVSHPTAPWYIWIQGQRNLEPSDEVP